MRRLLPQSGTLVASALAVASTLAVVGRAGPDSIGEKDRRWRNGEVSVCWKRDLESFRMLVPKARGSGDVAKLPDAADRAAIANWARERFPKERLGLTFTGFRECASGAEDSNDLWLAWGVGLPHGTHGETIVGDPRSYDGWATRLRELWNGPRRVKSGVSIAPDNWAKFVDDKSDLVTGMLKVRVAREDAKLHDFGPVWAAFRSGLEEDIRRFVLLHELGHVGGLLHEESRTDYAQEQPAFCVQRATDAGTESSEKKRFGTAFDPFSVMNYCAYEIRLHYRTALAICDLGPTLVRGSVQRGLGTGRFDQVLRHCDFIRKNPLPVRLSPRDESGLRAIYLDAPVPRGAARDYRESETEKLWLEVLDLVSRVGY